MSIPRPKSSFLVPLLLAAGVLLALPRLPLLVHFEQLAFPAPEKFEPDSRFLEYGDADDLHLKVFHFTQAPQHPANIGSYFIDEEAREVMGPNGGDPVEWAQFLRQTRLQDDRLIVITSSLSWPDATELALLALQEQLDLTPTLVVGVRAELLNREFPLPPELQGSVIPLELPPGFTLPEVDHLTVAPSVTPPLFGISEVRGLKIEKDGDLIRIPMLIRWGDHILPSLQLACLLTSHHLQPSDLIIDPRGYLRLGKTGPIIRIDSSGFTSLPQETPDYQSASKLQIYPTRAETTKIIAPTSPPLPATGLASQLRQAFGQIPRLEKTYQRWPLAIEITLLALLSLILQICGRFWLFLPAILLAAGLSLLFQRWFPASPLILLLVAHLAFRIGRRSPPPPL